VALLTWQTDSFAYAESYDSTSGRYRGLRAQQVVSITEDSAGLLVKPEVARRQMDAERPASVPGYDGPIVDPIVTHVLGDGRISGVTTRAPTTQQPRRFHGTVELDPARVGRDASRIADEVIAHLVGQVGADVRVTLEIEASLPSGASDQIVRTVTENSRTLKFTSHAFERE
jgi:hypothetical protein